jgi:hypothetical protein
MNKIIDYTKSHLPLVGGIALAIIVLAIILIVALGGGDGDTGEWGEGITKDIPEFASNSESMEFGTDNTYAAAYYTDVTSEQVAEYIGKLETELGARFTSDKYPCSAVLEDRIITLHYNVTEKRFSVTITAKTITSGEEQ